MRIKAAPVRPNEEYTAPAKSYSHDAGFDLSISRPVVIYPQTFAMVPTNIAMAIPIGYWGLLLGRSSTFVKRNLMVHQGTIDSGYRGEITGLVYNPMDRSVKLKAGERVFQLIVMPLGMTQYHADSKVKMVKTLPGAQRGTKGIGSTGGGV